MIVTNKYYCVIEPTDVVSDRKNAHYWLLLLSLSFEVLEVSNSDKEAF